MTGPTVHLAFLGCGRATAMHSRTLRAFPAVRRYYASRDPGRAASFAGRWGGEAFANYEQALSDARVGVVVIATPPALHLPLTLDALLHGKHVVVEKPPFLTVRELDRAADHARSAGRQILVAENYAYKPLTRALRRLIEGGILGDILFLQVNALKRQPTGGWRDDPRLAGGGALFEGGVHWVSLLAGIGLEITSARAVPAGPSADGGRSALVVLEYRRGAVATILHSWDAHSPLRGIRLSRVYGTRGSAVFESNGLFLAAGPRPRLSFPGLRDLMGYRSMFDDFLHALHEDRPPRYTLARARHDLELLETMRTRDPAGPPAGP